MSMKFGAVPTDHMLEIDYDKTKGWGKPIIREFQNFSIHPFNTTLHYAIECFEGNKYTNWAYLYYIYSLKHITTKVAKPLKMTKETQGSLEQT